MSKDPFKTRLEIAKKKASKRNFDNKNHNPSPIGTAFKLSTELVSAVAVGTIIGFILDSWFDTKPWLIIIFFFLGAAADFHLTIFLIQKYHYCHYLFVLKYD